MKLIDPKELRVVILDVLTQARNTRLSVNSEAVRAIVDEKIRFFEMVLIFVSKYEKEEDYTMDNMKRDLVLETVKLSDILPRRREGVLEPLILEYAKRVETNPADALVIDPKSISWGNFSNCISRMHRKGILTRNVRAMKRQGKFYLIYQPVAQEASKS